MKATGTVIFKDRSERQFYLVIENRAIPIHLIRVNREMYDNVKVQDKIEVTGEVHGDTLKASEIKNWRVENELNNLIERLS